MLVLIDGMALSQQVVLKYYFECKRPLRTTFTPSVVSSISTPIGSSFLIYAKQKPILNTMEHRKLCSRRDQTIQVLFSLTSSRCKDSALGAALFGCQRNNQSSFYDHARGFFVTGISGKVNANSNSTLV